MHVNCADSEHKNFLPHINGFYRISLCLKKPKMLKYLVNFEWDNPLLTLAALKITLVCRWWK